MIKTFLNLIKPSYDTYIIVGEWEFTESAAARDVGFDGSETHYVPNEHGDEFARHDGWLYPKLDAGRKFDSSCRAERLLLTKIMPEYILHDDAYAVGSLDNIAPRRWDSGHRLDSVDKTDALNLINQ